MPMKDKVAYWDILKGYSILAIVCGNFLPQIGPYLAVFNIALFFFVGAYFYNEEKYVQKPFEYVGELFRENWTKYVFYMSVFAVFHNFSVRFGLYFGQPYYTFQDMCKVIAGSFAFSGSELFGGPMWIIVPNVVSCAALALLVAFSDRIGNCVPEKYKNLIKYAVLLVLGGILFMYFSKHQVIYFVNIVFLIMPFTLLAYFLKKINEDEYKKFLNPIIAILFGYMIYVLVKYTKLPVYLGSNIYPGKRWYLFMAFMGIYAVMTLARLTEKIPYINKCIAFLGKHYFSVLALSLVAVKLCDRMYAFFTGEKNTAIFANWMTAYSNKLWWVYLIVATALPAIFGYLINLLKVKIETKIKKEIL